MTIDDKRNYESTFIVTPELEEADYKAIIEKFNGVVTKNGGKILNQEVWGNKKLAYPIAKRTSGYYVFSELEAPASSITALEREYEFDERVLRYLTVKMDHNGVAFAEKRRANLKKKKKETA